MVNPKLDALGIVWMVWSAFTGLVGLGVAALAMGLGGLVALVPDTSTGEPAPWWVGFLFGGFGLAFGLFFAAMGGFGIAMGRSLRRGRKWAIVAACILGFFQLSNFPLGTLLGVWTFVVGVPALKDEPTG